MLGELWFGVDNSASRDRNIPILVAAVSDWTVWPYDTAAAREYGRIAAELKRIGRPMQQIDMMIAAIAKSLNSCIIVTADQDLFAVPGLTIENWESTT